MSTFTPQHRGGDGPPMLALHGITDTWRTWELVLPRLEKHFEVLAPTLPGHAGGLARSVVVLAPAGGWEPKTGPPPEIFEDFERSYAQMKAGYSSLASLVSTPEGRHLATRRFTVNYEHLPADLVLHLLEGVALCEGERLVEYGRRADWGVATQQVSCPTRIVWGRADSILPYPQSALRLQREMPHADWVELDDVGHCPQLDVPLVAAELITNFAGSL